MNISQGPKAQHKQKNIEHIKHRAQAMLQESREEDFQRHSAAVKAEKNRLSPYTPPAPGSTDSVNLEGRSATDSIPESETTSSQEDTFDFNKEPYGWDPSHFTGNGEPLPSASPREIRNNRWFWAP